MNWLLASRVRTVLLPLALSAATVLGLGSYYETNDDATLAWLFAGVLALKPVPSVPLYLHGYGHLLAAAYAAVPGGPWLGLLLGTLLAAATGLTFAVLDRLLRAHLRPGRRALALTLFFGLAWLEHWLWFSHGRVALLLAGAGVLYAAQRAGRGGALLLGLLALAAAWLVRPGLATLGAAAAVPAALLLAGGWRRAAPVLGGAALGLALAAGLLHGRQTPAEARARQRDAVLARILDFDQLRPAPRTPADRLGTAAVGQWLLGDTTVVNQGLFRRAYQFEARAFLTREVPAKLRLRAGLLVRDYFPLLLALAATAGAVGRGRGPGRRPQQPGPARWFWLVQLGFAGALLGLAGLFKLPPRLALPLLDFWLLTNLVFWLSPARPAGEGDTAPAAARPPGPGRPAGGRALAAVVAGVVLLYGAKTAHRRHVLGQEQQRHESALAALRRQPGRPVRILGGANDWLKSLSPFREYRPGPGPVLLLTGWVAHDASQARLRRALSGAAGQADCLRRLAGPGAPTGPGRPAATLWLLTPETADWLNRRFAFGGLGLRLRQMAGPPLPGAVATYRIEPGPGAGIP